MRCSLRSISAQLVSFTRKSRGWENHHKQQEEGAWAHSPQASPAPPRNSVALRKVWEQSGPLRAEGHIPAPLFTSTPT